MILRRIFDGRNDGFYVDVGAHHPQRFSNTYYFYLRGWRGINIDATPGSMNQFNKIRPHDVNVEAAIAREKKDITFFMFDEPALNSFDEELSQSRNNTVYKIIEKKIISTKTLAEILSEYLPPDQSIDFISIDVEGLDLEVLESNDWERFKPYCVLVECYLDSLDGIEKNNVYKYLQKRNYKLFAKTANTFIFTSGS